MAKREFIEKYRTKFGEHLSKKEAELDIQVFFESLQEALLNEGKVYFFKKGHFEILDKKPRNIANPVTKEIMKIYPEKIVKFKASTILNKEFEEK